MVLWLLPHLGGAAGAAGGTFLGRSLGTRRKSRWDVVSQAKVWNKNKVQVDSVLDIYVYAENMGYAL
jgi:hypothetical protein